MSKELFSLVRLANRISARKKEESDYLEDELEINQDDTETDETDDQSAGVEEGPNQEDLSDDKEIDITQGNLEYACRMEVGIDANFEGSISKEELVSSIKKNLKASISLAMKQLAEELSLSSVDVKVRPVVTDCALVDEMDEGMDEFGRRLESESEGEEDQLEESASDSESDDSEDDSESDSEDSEDAKDSDDDSEDTEEDDDYEDYQR